MEEEGEKGFLIIRKSGAAISTRTRLAVTRLLIYIGLKQNSVGLVTIRGKLIAPRRSFSEKYASATYLFFCEL